MPEVVLAVQFERLIQSYEGVVSVGTDGADGETKVDLGVGADGGGHG